MTVSENNIFKIINECSGLVLEVEGEATTEGTQIEQYTDTGKDHQWWSLKPAGSDNEDFYNIENVHSTMSLEVVGYSTAAGTEIVQRPYGDGPLHRQWKLVPVTGKADVYKIENRNSGLVLDDEDGRKDPPAPVKQYESWNDDGRQQWKFIPVPAPVTPTPPLLRDGQIIGLRADDGKYLQRVDSTNVLNMIQAVGHTTGAYNRFKVIMLPDGRIALQADNKNYLSRIARSTRIEAAKSTIDDYCKFQVTIDKDKIALQADDGKYLRRISGSTRIEAANKEVDKFCWFTVVTVN